MEDEDYQFCFFSQRKQDGAILIDECNINKIILPSHPNTHDVDSSYLKTMLMYFDPSRKDDCRENVILDAFPIISLTTDKNDKFYLLSIARLEAFRRGEIAEDGYVRSTITQLFMYLTMENENTYIELDKDQTLNYCLETIQPQMYIPHDDDRVDCEGYDLSRIASYIPTSRFSRLKILKGWIENALHYYNYSIMFFDINFIGYDDFNENIIDINSKMYGYIQSTEQFEPKSVSFDTSLSGPHVMYFEKSLKIVDYCRNWLLTTPSNDNERDCKVMMFRNKKLKQDLQYYLDTLFEHATFGLNDVFKWNRYNEGGKFDSHYDTMFVQKLSNECSLYTLLVYIEVADESYMYLGENEECKLKLQSNYAYVIPHWVKHRACGKGLREFIKTEIIFPVNPTSDVLFDQSLVDAFDKSCYYMLHCVRHPQLKSIISKSFNTINEARFYKTKYTRILENNIFLLKTMHNIPVKYKTTTNLHKYTNETFHYASDGIYYYFKVNKNELSKITPNEMQIILTLMYLDIHPKKMFGKTIRICECNHPGCIDYYYKSSDIKIFEMISYWCPEEHEAKLDEHLLVNKLSQSSSMPLSVGNVSIPNIDRTPLSFYFAACQNIYDTYEKTQEYVTKMYPKSISNTKDNLEQSDIKLIGPQKNIVKIRQHSFQNGIQISREWVEKFISQ